MVYHKNGDMLAAIFLKNGAMANGAYDVNGNDIFGERDYSRYEQYVITNIGGSVSQGCDIYGETLAVWNGSNTVTLRDISTMNVIMTASATESNHGNDITFTDEFYSRADYYPLLFVNGTFFYRIDGNTLTLVRKIVLPTIDTYNLHYGNEIVGHFMYAMGYKNNYTYSAGNDIKIAIFDMSNLTDNGDGTFTPALVSSVNRDWLECIQGSSYHDGLLWIACGIGGNPGHIYALEPSTGEIMVDINLTATGELEGLAWAYNATDGWYMVVGQRNIGFRKVTFSN